MNPDVLNKVLACERLPSLPAVALRVLELSQDQQVSYKELAETITNDQALSSKVLRTVNSSFYALRKPCSSINQAIVMLGLSAVKTLALGFSLVSSLSKYKNEEFDFQTYWKRTLISGIAAKCVAAEAKTGNDEECFLGGMLQDVGMIAMYLALGPEYNAVIARCNGDLSQLTKHEIADFEVTHADIGAMLARRWKLPDTLVMPIKFHERPTAAPQECVKHVQAVALGNIAADVIMSAEPGIPLKRLYSKAEQWFALKNNQVDDLMKAVNQGVSEIARLFSVDVGTLPEHDEMMSRAGKQLESIALPFGMQPDPNSDIDPHTGLAGRQTFNQNIVGGFEQARGNVRPLAIALISFDQLESLAAQGPAFAAAGWRAAGELLAPTVQSAGGLLVRFDDQHFAAVLSGLDRAQATRLAQALTQAVQTPVKVQPPGMMPVTLSLTFSIGVAAVDATTKDRFNTIDELIDVTRQALAAARRAGHNTVRVYAPKLAA